MTSSGSTRTPHETYDLSLDSLYANLSVSSKPPTDAMLSDNCMPQPNFTRLAPTIRHRHQSTCLDCHHSRRLVGVHFTVTQDRGAVLSSRLV